MQGAQTQQVLLIQMENNSSTRRKHLISDALLGILGQDGLHRRKGLSWGQTDHGQTQGSGRSNPVNHKPVAQVMRELTLFDYTKEAQDHHHRVRSEETSVA